MSSKLFITIIIIINIFLLVSCNLTKLVPKDDYLYTGATVKIEDSTLSKKEKKNILQNAENLPRPKPNSRFLGIPIKLMLYNMGGDPEKTSFIRKFFRKIGQPPVLLSELDLEYNTKVLDSHLENRGYFKSEISGDTIVKKRKARAIYQLTPGSVYTISEVKYKLDSGSLARAIYDTRPGSILHPGNPFNLDVIKGERLRIDAILKENGYYFFKPEALIVEADSTIGLHKVDLHLKVKESTPPESKKPFIINDVYIYPDYSLNADSLDTSLLNKSLYKGFYIVDPLSKFKAKLFPQMMRFDSGDVYNRTDHNLTLSRLINLDIFKFVKNRFEVSPLSKPDTGRLNVYYYLTPQPKKSINAEISASTKSNNFVGSEFKMTFRNRNTFKAAEHLDIYANIGSEVQYSGHQSGFNTLKLGGGIKFTIPKFVVPFFRFNTHNAFVPKSKIELSYDLLNRRKLYTLNSLKAELGYSWKPNIKVEQDLNPISINFIKAINITDLYRDSILKDPVLRHAVDTQFIIGSNYSYTINPLVKDPTGSGYFFNGIADLSGNLAGLLVKDGDHDGKKRILDRTFAQYVKTQLDFRYYHAFNPKARLANRMILGIGFPYGNSHQLPFIKQFFIGGNNSLRGFRSRSVGPGTYRDPNADSLLFAPDQSGDIKLEFNSEIRVKLNNILEGAFFVDAGNIWLYNEDTSTIKQRRGVKFSKDFMKELAVSTGVGLRIDLTILLLRIDIAMPVRKPWLPGGNRWVFDGINFGDKDWRRKNLILNLGIGYPF